MYFRLHSLTEVSVTNENCSTVVMKRISHEISLGKFRETNNFASHGISETFDKLRNFLSVKRTNQTYTSSKCAISFVIYFSKVFAMQISLESNIQYGLNSPIPKISRVVGVDVSLQLQVVRQVAARVQAQALWSRGSWSYQGTGNRDHAESFHDSS